MPLKALTPEEYFDKCRSVHGDDTYDYSNAIYVSTKKKVLNIKCNHCGHIFSMIGRDHLYNRQGCPNCASERHANKISMTFENFLLKAIKVHGTEKYEYIDYQKVKGKRTHIVTIRCKKCGTIFTLVATEHLGNLCCCPNKCFYTEVNNLIQKRKKQPMTTERFIRESIDYFEDKFDYSKIGIVNCTRMKVTLICKTCGCEFLVKVGSHLYAHRGCPECAKNVNRKTKEQFISELNRMYGEDVFDYKYLEYKDVYTNVHLVCKRCGKDVYQTPSNLLLGNGHHCEYDSNISSGEGRIIEVLKEMNIKYVYQYSVKNDTGISLNKIFNIDFYIESYNLFIEFNGAQHYKSVKKFGRDEKFEKQKERDNALRVYCKNNNIDLLEIRYDEYYKIKDILIEKLNDIKKRQSD